MLAKLLAKLRKNDQGSTLVESMMVVLLLGSMAGVAAPMVEPVIEQAWTAKLMTTADTLGLAVIADAILSSGSYSFPTTQVGFKDLLDELVALPPDVNVQYSGPIPVDGSGGYMLVYHIQGESHFWIDGYYNGKKLFGDRIYRWQ